MLVKRLCTSLRNKRCMFFIISFASVISLFVINGFYQIKKKSCSESEGRRILAELCHLYHRKQVTGDLCHDLCDLNSIELKSCLSGGASKSVILASWDGSPVVLKSRPRDPKDLQPLTVWEVSNDKQERVSVAPEVETFELMIHSEVSALLNIKIAEDKRQLVALLSGDAYNPDNEKPTLPFMNSLMTLVQQEEYVNFKSLRSSIGFPDVYGFCGHFYGVEFIPPDRMLSSISLWSYRNHLSWKDRVKIALNLIDIIISMDRNFEQGEESLHMCDMKAENFGVGEDFTVKIIDGDMIFSSAKMSSILEAENCSVDQDCDFFDCHGVCDVTKKRCTRVRRNLNFQVLCRDIFSTGLRGTQLLQAPPVEFEDRIRAEVERCSKLERDDRVRPGWDPSLMLRGILRYSCRDL